MTDLAIHYLNPDDYPSTGEGSHPLWDQYPGQSHPQGAYISLDCSDGHVWANYNGEIGNAVPMAVYHGHIQRFGIANDLRADNVNAVMRDAEPYPRRILAGYTSTWNGQNEVARFTDDAHRAIEELDTWSFAYELGQEPCDDDCRVCYGDES